VPPVATAAPLEIASLDKEDHRLSRSATCLRTLKASVGLLAGCNPAD
jgi:hypothetical protein